MTKRRGGTPRSAWLISVVALAIVLGFMAVVRTAKELEAQVVNPPDGTIAVTSVGEFEVLRNIFNDAAVRGRLRTQLGRETGDGGSNVGASCTGLWFARRPATTPRFVAEFDFAVSGDAVVVEYTCAASNEPPSSPHVRSTLTDRVVVRTIPSRAERGDGIQGRHRTPSGRTVFDDDVEVAFLAHALTAAHDYLAAPIDAGWPLRDLWVERACGAGRESVVAGFNYVNDTTGEASTRLVIADYGTHSGFSELRVSSRSEVNHESR